MKRTWAEQIPIESKRGSACTRSSSLYAIKKKGIKVFPSLKSETPYGDRIILNLFWSDEEKGPVAFLNDNCADDGFFIGACDWIMKVIPQGLFSQLENGTEFVFLESPSLIAFWNRLESRNMANHGGKSGRTVTSRHEVSLGYEEAIQKFMEAISESHVSYEGGVIKIKTVIHLS